MDDLNSGGRWRVYRRHEGINDVIACIPLDTIHQHKKMEDLMDS